MIGGKRERLREASETFIREKQCLRNCSPYSIINHQAAWDKYRRYCREFNKPALNEFVIRMREEKLSPHTCNSYIRGINRFLTWLHENEVIPDNWKIKILKTERRVKTSPSDEDVKRLFHYQPKTFAQARIQAIGVDDVGDRGIRVGEAFALTKDTFPWSEGTAADQH